MNAFGNHRNKQTCSTWLKACATLLQEAGEIHQNFLTISSVYTKESLKTLPSIHSQATSHAEIFIFFALLYQASMLNSMTF